MMIPAPLPGTSGNNRSAGARFGAPEQQPATRPAPPVTVAPALAYADFVAAIKNALRDFHSPDLLARNPLLRDGIRNLGEDAGPRELKALLSATVSTLFGNPRDEKLRRIIELTYFQPTLKQEALADRLSLSFGTYRRHLTTARDRLARWLWESSQAQPELLAAAGLMATEDKREGNTATPSGAGEPAAPRLSLVVLPFLNIGGSSEDAPFVDGITETLTTDLSRSSGVVAICDLSR